MISIHTLKAFLTKKKYYPVELSHTRSNHLTLNGKINNVSGIFILDTGAAYTCIDRNKSNHFNLVSRESKICAAGVGSINMSIEIADKTNIVLGKWQASKIKLKLIDFSHINQALQSVGSEEVHGIIGADILRRGKAVIDYSRKIVYLK